MLPIFVLADSGVDYEEAVHYTNNYIYSFDKYNMLNKKGWARSEVSTYANFLGIDVIFNGTGYVKEFSIEKDTEITEDMILNVTLEPKFVDDVKLEEKKDDKKES